MYHNTLAHEGDQLRTYHQKALSQDEIILHWFKTAVKTAYSPSEVWLAIFHDEKGKPTCPLTSVRRSMTDMPELEKTPRTREGLFRRQEHYWRLADPVQGELI
jgi:hypothetical protein